MAYKDKNQKKLYERARYYRKRKEILEQKKAYYKKNTEEKKQYNKLYQEKNREKLASYNRNLYQKQKAERLQSAKKYRKENSAKINALAMNRIARKKQATPKWMTKQDFADIAEFYKIAKELQWLSEEPLHVDHIIPLKGKNVCGLHIAANLQILPASMNIRKGNRL